MNNELITLAISYEPNKYIPKEVTCFVPLKEMRAKAMWHILMFINQWKTNDVLYRLSLIENHAAIGTALKNIALGVILSLGKYNRDGSIASAQNSQPFLLGDNKKKLIYELSTVLTTLSMETLSDEVTMQHISDAAYGIYSECENTLIETLNLLFGKYFPTAECLVRVGSPSQDPDGDIFMVIDANKVV